MQYDGSLIFDTKINTSGFSAGLGSLGSLASAGIGSITGLFKAGASAVLDFGKASLETGSEFEAAVTQIAATMGFTVDELKNQESDASRIMQKFADKAKELGAGTFFTAGQAAEGLNVLAMQGWGEAAIGISDAALDFATAGKISIENSASYLGAAMKGFTEETGKFGDEAETAAHYADLLARGMNLASTDADSLGTAFSSMSATANGFHQSAEELEVLLLRLAEQNVIGSNADTAARSLLTHLYTPLESAQKILDQIGFSAYDETGTRNLNEALDDLNQKIRDYAAEQAHFVGGAEKNAELIADLRDDIAKNIQARDKKEANGTLSDEERADYDDLISAAMDKIAELESQPGRQLTESEIYLNTVYRIFGQRGQPAFMKAANTNPEKTQYFFDQLAAADGAAAGQAAVQESSLQGKLTLLDSALQALEIEIYEAIDEPFKISAANASGYLDALTNAMKEGGFPALLETFRENALPWADETISVFADAFGLSDAWNAFKEDPAGVIAQTAVDLLLKGGEALTQNLGILLPAIETVSDAVFDELETDENKERLTKVGGDLFKILVDGALQAPVDIFGIAARISQIGLQTAMLTDWESISEMALKGLFSGIGSSLLTMLDGSDWAVGMEDLLSKGFDINFDFRGWAEYLRDEYNPEDMWQIYDEALSQLRQSAQQDFENYHVFPMPAAERIPTVENFFQTHGGGGNRREASAIEINQNQTLELDGRQIAEFTRKTSIDDNAVSGGW